MRTRGNVQVCYVSAKESSLNSSTSLAALLAVYDTVFLQPGTHFTSTTLTIPAGKTLDGTQEATLKAVNSSTQNDILILQSGPTSDQKTIVNGITVDGNISARESAGFSSYCHGIRASNRKNIRITNNVIVGAGEAVAYGQEFSAGIFVECTSSATDNSENIEIHDNEVDDIAYRLAFGIRCRTDFAGGLQPGDNPFWLQDFTVLRNLVTGTIKNSGEIVGVNTRRGEVRDNVFDKPGGQGGCEGDFGSQTEMSYVGNIVRNVGVNGIQAQNHDAFSDRCGEFTDGTPGVRPSGNVFENNRLENSVQRGSFFLRGMSLFGSDQTIVRGLVISNVTKAEGATSNRIIGVSLNAKIAAVTSALIEGCDFGAAEIPIRLTDTTEGVSGIVMNLTQAQSDAALAAESTLASYGTINVV